MNSFRNIYNSNLSHRAKSVYMYLKDRADSEGRCWPAIRTIALEFMFEWYVELDERWLFDLAKDPEGRKPTVTWQTYNRGGVLYGSYDEMFISLLPRKVENPELKRILREYFRIRSEKVKVEESITVYKEAAERFGDE